MNREEVKLVVVARSKMMQLLDVWLCAVLRWWCVCTLDRSPSTGLCLQAPRLASGRSKRIVLS